MLNMMFSRSEIVAHTSVDDMIFPLFEHLKTIYTINNLVYDSSNDLNRTVRKQSRKDAHHGQPKTTRSP